MYSSATSIPKFKELSKTESDSTSSIAPKKDDLFLIKKLAVPQKEIIGRKEQLEPGYANSFISAYLFALQKVINNEKITFNIIDKIHDLATSHLNSDIRGMVTIEDSTYGYSLSIEVPDHPPMPGTTEIDYIKEFTRQVIYDLRPATEITLRLLTKQGKRENFIIHRVNSSKIENITIPNGRDFLRLNKQQKLSFFNERAKIVINEITLENRKTRLDQLHSIIDKMPSGVLDVTGEDSIIISHILFPFDYRKKIEQIMDKYYSQINKINNENCKLELISATLQNIFELHPFRDGNGRTLAIILSSMLIENNLADLAGLHQHINFGGYTVESLSNKIKEEQQNFKHEFSNIYDFIIALTDEFLNTSPEFKDLTLNLQKHGMSKVFLLYTPSLKLSRDSIKLIDEMINKICLHDYPDNFSSAIKNSLLEVALNNIKLPSINKELSILIDSLNTKKLDLMLRQSCTNKTYLAITKCLLDYANQVGIDINACGSKTNSTALTIAYDNKNHTAMKEIITRFETALDHTITDSKGNNVGQIIISLSQHKQNC